MFKLFKLPAAILPISIKLPNSRSFAVSSRLLLKEIQEAKDGNHIIIKGVEKPSPREPFLLNVGTPSACPLCHTGLDVKHTDVLILSQFVRQDGCMLPKRVTGLCHKQQRKVSSLVTMAQKAGLMPNLNPAKSKKDPKTRYGYKRYNKYFDESTIKVK